MAWAAFRDALLRMEGASGQVLIEVCRPSGFMHLMLCQIRLMGSSPMSSSNLPPNVAHGNGRCADAGAGCSAEHILFKLPGTTAARATSAGAAAGARLGLLSSYPPPLSDH